MNTLLIAVAASLLGGAVGALLGHSRGNTGNGFWLGALLGPLGWLLTWIGPDRRTPETTAGPGR